jgi:hypothetical protein
MEMFLPESVKTVLLGLIAGAIVLGWLAPKFPDIAWLQIFRLPQRQLSPAEQERRRRAGNRHAAIEMMLAGLIVPMLYVVSTVMMFNDFGAVGMVVTSAISLTCFGGGVWLLVRNW